MYISKLHLHGFKSFLNKTDLSFGEGITVVVGPNGCGKSNIVDAIRWILGEQKISVLRSTKKEDVIFNGSKHRKPLSFCEASMLIHNNRDILPLEYNDVEITRRLYRSGESEFYINKTPCRLKDIHNLFVDTGMSSNAYSVIELKMVDSILSHNADDRRHMFEEAAGINHYKQQRLAAMRKLEVMRSDMERINDIIIEVKNTVINLSLQMKRYERHSKLTAELKQMEIETAQIEIQLILEKHAPIDIKLNKIKGEHSSLSDQMNLDEILVDEVEKLFQKQKKEFNAYQAEQSQLENKIIDLNSKLLLFSEKISGNENQKMNFKDELDHCATNITVINNKIKELIRLKDDLGPDVTTRKNKFKKTEGNYCMITKKYDQLRLELQESKKKSEHKFLKIREEDASTDRLITTIYEKEKYLDKLQEKSEVYLLKQNNSQAEINFLRTKVEKHKKDHAKITVEIQKQKKKYSHVEGEILNSKNLIIEHNSQKHTLIAQIQFYNNIITTHGGSQAGVKKILQNNIKYPYVLGVLSDLIQVKAPYHTAVESVLGEFSQYLLVDTQENAYKLMQNTNHRLSVIALSSIDSIASNNRHYPANTLLSTITYNKQLDPLLHILMGDVCILPKRQDHPETGKYDEFDWVSETGCYFKRGYIFKSSGKGRPSIIGRREKIEELTKILKDNDKEIIKMEKDLQKSINIEKSIQGKLLNQTKVLDGVIKILNESEQKITQQDYILIQQQESIREIKEETIRMKNQIIDLNISLHSIRGKANIFRNEYDDLTSNQEACKQKMDKFRSKRNILLQDVQDARIKLMEIEKENEGLEDRIQTVSEQDKDLGERMLKYESDLHRLDQENKGLATSISNTKNKLKELNTLLELTSLQKVKRESEYNKTYIHLRRLQSGIRDRQKRKDIYLDTIREYELQILEGNHDINQNRKRILDLYHENLPDVSINLADFDLSLNKSLIKRIHRSLERIGPVNMAVADEYEQESERYDFLTKQFGDLEESEMTLKETIEKLDVEAQGKFIETFDVIKENFTQTFTSFFDGGEGHLSLVTEDDPLGADIEIIACPPGKKAQTLRVLSAGEKALTAIALLFAIYLVKPSPFCILDEVDAPLDDININKFTKVLREFSNRTQFIVVTHNKLTMEKADYMYGITQQEEGVSKIVSVKLNKGVMEEAFHSI